MAEVVDKLAAIKFVYKLVKRTSRLWLVSRDLSADLMWSSATLRHKLIKAFLAVVLFASLAVVAMRSNILVVASNFARLRNSVTALILKLSDTNDRRRFVGPVAPPFKDGSIQSMESRRMLYCDKVLSFMSCLPSKTKTKLSVVVVPSMSVVVVVVVIPVVSWIFALTLAMLSAGRTVNVMVCPVNVRT